ncbi:single-stranded DNA-binding protein [Macrococcoides bohemicum]|uniref:single-stranded DNA-binding protein n=1 Tax=Macrococcoides bohemicum TaxID=1903056 RepID=UPI00289E79A6|nr:single-stranded DNA-binding protein [Macrococcus bohemicus]
MNDCKFIGRITKEPEYRVTPSGAEIINFDLAVQRKYKNQNDEYEADFIRCVAFKKTAEFIQKYAKKGYVMSVTGEMRNNNYEDQNGVMHYGMQLIVNNVDSQVLFLNKKQDDVQQQQSRQSSYTQPQSTTGQNNNPFANSGPIDISDDDLPF